MTKLCRFTELDETTSYINPMLVRVVRTDPHGGATIYFDEDHKIAVREQPNAVVGSLESSLRSA